jgi:hypothetical protein
MRPYAGATLKGDVRERREEVVGTRTISLQVAVVKILFHRDVLLHWLEECRASSRCKRCVGTGALLHKGRSFVCVGLGKPALNFFWRS